MKRILIITAHLDDFELGMGGTAIKLSEDTDSEIGLVVLCNGERPGNEHVASPRKDACLSNCKQLGIKHVTIKHYPDTRLDKVSQTTVCNDITSIVNEFKPTIVYTHFGDDVHNDHRIVSNATRVACRMRINSTVEQLFEFSVPGSTEWGLRSFNYNSYVNITDFHSQKIALIEKYATELRHEPDPISVKSIHSRDKYIGTLCGYDFAESFKLIFHRDEKTCVDDS